MAFFLPKESVVIVEKMHLYIQKLISFTNKGVGGIMFFFVRNRATQPPVYLLVFIMTQLINFT
jgi:hypothetical protein